MRPLLDLSIKKKLLVITMVTVAASLLLTGIGIVISDSILFRSGMQRDIAALASIVGDNSTAALSFDDPTVAKETLAPLKAKPHMLAACIFKPDGELFADYRQPNSTQSCDAPTKEEEIRFSGSQLIASHPIILENKRIGTLVMHYDLGEVAERTRLYVIIVIGILLVSSLMAFFLSAQLGTIIATPIARLAKAAASVSQTGDYGVRVEKYSRDELGVLVDAFNEMLARVQSRDIEVQDARNSLQTTLTSIGDAVISTDARGCIVLTNPAAGSLLRLSGQELEGKHIDQVFHIVNEHSGEKLETPIHKVLRQETTVARSDHAVLMAADGTRFPIDGSAAPIRDARGDMTGVVLIFRDITSRRETEKLLETQAAELRQRAQLLKDADERKDQFLAMLAHELRNPLAPIRNAVHVIQRIGTASSSHQWASEVIERQTQHLTRLVDDLLDVSRITRGKVTLKQEPLELTTIINSAVEMSRPIIDARKHHLSMSLPTETVRIKGDLTRLAQVVGNILNNAAKFTDSGGVIRLEAQSDKNEVVIRVIDNGIGISSSLLPHVFDLFAQADPSLDRSQGGLGIGLTLARTLVEMHGGDVQARSDGLGHGSEFIVRLPALPSSPRANELSNKRTAAADGSLRILVLEDNPDSAEMLRFLLQLDGHEVHVVLQGTEALDAARAFQPEVVLCDIGLPGLNGYQVAMQLRSDPQFAATHLIAISGYGQEEDRLRSRQAGFEHHLTKPVEPDVLTSLLRSIHFSEKGSIRQPR